MKLSKVVAAAVMVGASLAAASVHAELIAWTPNKDSGLIKLYDSMSYCQSGEGGQATTSGEHGNVLEGCWYVPPKSEGIFRIRWSDGQTETYSQSALTFTKNPSPRVAR
jgi:hypothetical protein